MAPTFFKNLVVVASGTFPGYKQGKEKEASLPRLAAVAGFEVHLIYLTDWFWIY